MKFHNSLSSGLWTCWIDVLYSEEIFKDNESAGKSYVGVSCVTLRNRLDGNGKAHVVIWVAWNIQFDYELSWWTICERNLKKKKKIVNDENFCFVFLWWKNERKKNIKEDNSLRWKMRNWMWIEIHKYFLEILNTQLNWCNM